MRNRRVTYLCKHSITLKTNLLIPVHANLGHFGWHQPKYMDAKCIEFTDIIINHFLSEGMRNLKLLWISVIVYLGILLFLPLASIVLHCVAWIYLSLMRLSTFVHLLPFVIPESFGRRKMTKNKTRVPKIVVLRESLPHHWNCLGICYSSCIVTVEIIPPLHVWPPVYGRQQPYVSQSTQCTSLLSCSSLCAIVILHYLADNRCSKIGFE